MNINLNLHVIWDELHDEKGELICSDDIHSHLSSIRFLHSEDSLLSKQYLYMTDAQTLSCISDRTNKLSFICIGEICRSVIEDRGWSAIILPGNSDPNQVFQNIQEIFEKFVQWEKDMLLSIADNQPLQSIFNCGVHFLRNPIALFDSSQALIMVAGDLPENIENTIWEDVLSKGYSRVENFPIEEQRTLEKFLSERDEPFIYQSKGKFSNHQQIVASLNYKGTRLGTFGMIDIVKPFSLGQLSVVSYLKSFIELALRPDKQQISMSDGASYFVERLLQGLSVERNAVKYHLSKRNWFIEENFCLLYFTRTDNSQIDRTLEDMYVFRIQSMFADSMVLPYENGLLAIIRKGDQLRTDNQLKHDLSQLLKMLGLSCGVSLVFYDFMNLKYAYIQCKTAMISYKDNPEQQIYLFETQYSDHIIKALETSTSLKSLCHPKILQLFNEDSGKGLEFVHTLQVYLANGRNKTATSDQLFVHRNTLIYRLSRVEEILGIDLEDADEQTLFILLMSCLIANYIKRLR